MNPILRNILAVIVGLIVGSMVNFGLIGLGHSVFPIEGVDLNDMEALAEVMPDLGAKHFIFPFLAHALGTLVGAAVAAYIAISHKIRFALIVGLIFFISGIIACFMIPAPIWYVIVDVLLAYIPMAWIGGKWASR